MNVRRQSGTWQGLRSRKSLLRRLEVTEVLLFLILLLFAPIGCDTAAAGTEDEADTQSGSDDDSPPTASDEEALEAILCVYEELNYYAMRTPEPEGASTSFASGTVTVTKQDSTDDVMNAYYEDTVRVDFDGFTGSCGSITGTVDVVAFIDSYNGSEGATYTGDFTGTYERTSFTLTMNYTVENSATSGIQSSGTFVFNGRPYEVEADSDMFYNF